MTWKYEKFKGNGAIYAFCPMRGEYLYDDIEHATCVWNERDMEELYSEEEGNKYE